MIGLMPLVGLGVAIIEFIIAAVSYSFYRKAGEGFEWMKYFVAAVALLGVGHLVCKFVGHGLLGLPMSYALGVPFKFLGIVLLVYSLLTGVNYKRAKEVTALAVALGIYFVASAYYTLTLLRVRDSIYFSTSHLLFLLLFPWYVGFVLYEVYKESGDANTLAFSVGMFVYGLAAVVNAALLAVGVPMNTSMSVKLVVRMIALLIILGGLVKAIKG